MFVVSKFSFLMSAFSTRADLEFWSFYMLTTSLSGASLSRNRRAKLKLANGESLSVDEGDVETVVSKTAEKVITR